MPILDHENEKRILGSGAKDVHRVGAGVHCESLFLRLWFVVRGGVSGVVQTLADFRGVGKKKRIVAVLGDSVKTVGRVTPRSVFELFSFLSELVFVVFLFQVAHSVEVDSVQVAFPTPFHSFDPRSMFQTPLRFRHQTFGKAD